MYYGEDPRGCQHETLLERFPFFTSDEEYFLFIAELDAGIRADLVRLGIDPETGEDVASVSN